MGSEARNKISYIQSNGYGRKILRQKNVEIYSMIFQKGNVATLEV